MSKTKQLLKDLHLGTVKWFWFVAAQPVLFTLGKEESCIKPCVPQGHHPLSPHGTGDHVPTAKGCWAGGKQPVWSYTPLQPLPAVCQGWMMCWGLIWMGSDILGSWKAPGTVSLPAFLRAGLLHSFSETTAELQSTSFYQDIYC